MNRCKYDLQQLEPPCYAPRIETTDATVLSQIRKLRSEVYIFVIYREFIRFYLNIVSLLLCTRTLPADTP